VVTANTFVLALKSTGKASDITIHQHSSESDTKVWTASHSTHVTKAQSATRTYENNQVSLHVRDTANVCL